MITVTADLTIRFAVLELPFQTTRPLSLIATFSFGTTQTASWDRRCVSSEYNPL